MKAADVVAALRGRWPESEYLHVREAPQDAMRQGRKLDVLVVSLWRSRGYQLDGVEVKVSIADWRRELKEPAKADWWYEHVDRFWIAVPAGIAEQVRTDLPPTWGLLSVTDARVVELVKAPRHEREPFDWDATIGLLRAADGAGYAALGRAEARGIAEGERRARASFEKRTGDEKLRREHDDLLARVEAFERATGIDVGATWSTTDATRLGEVVASVRDWLHDPARAAAAIRRDAERVAETASALEKVASLLLGFVAPAGVASAEADETTEAT